MAKVTFADHSSVPFRLSITQFIEREPSKLIEAVSGGWPKVISNLKSLLETGSPSFRRIPALLRREAPALGRCRHGKGHGGKPFVGSGSAARSRQHSQILLRCPGRQDRESGSERDFIRLGADEDGAEGPNVAQVGDALRRMPP